MVEIQHNHSGILKWDEDYSAPAMVILKSLTKFSYSGRSVGILMNTK